MGGNSRPIRESVSGCFDRLRRRRMAGDIPQISADRWLKVVEVFGELKDLTPPDRIAHLDAACQGDSELRIEVEKLFMEDAAAEADDVLNNPIQPKRRRGPFEPGQIVAN